MRPRLILLTFVIAGLAACGGQAGDPMRGRQLYLQERLGNRQAPGCITCHTLVPGEDKVGPSHDQIGSIAEQRVSSPDYQGEAQESAGYLRESILDPDAHVVDGYEAGLMYQDYEEVLTDQQVRDLVAFLLSLE